MVVSNQQDTLTASKPEMRAQYELDRKLDGRGGEEKTLTQPGIECGFLLCSD
jgi:hypothetical protein